MSDTTESHGEPISVGEFWHLYGGSLLSKLRRRTDGSYHGTKLDHHASDSMFADLIDFSVLRESLDEHAYEDDERFDRQVSSSFSGALAAVLSHIDFDTPTVPNLARLSLVVHLLRNDLPSPTNEDQPEARRRIFTHVLLRELSHGEGTARLVALVPERAESFRAFSRAVLRRLQDGTFDLDQAEYLLSGAAPSPDIIAWHELRALVLETLETCEIDIQAVCRHLRQLLPSPADYERMVASGRISEARTERDVLLQALARCRPTGEAIEEISLILDNSDNEDLFLLIEAIRTLGRCNDKGAIEILIACLDREELERYRGDIEEALQRLCSGDTLIPVFAFGFDPEALTEEDFAAMEDLNEDEVRLERDYWRKVAADLPATSEEWLHHDARSVFWEKRLKYALDSDLPQDLRAELQGDEVLQVRLAAGADA